MELEQLHFFTAPFLSLFYGRIINRIFLFANFIAYKKRSN